MTSFPLPVYRVAMNKETYERLLPPESPVVESSVRACLRVGCMEESVALSAISLNLTEGSKKVAVFHLTESDMKKFQPAFDEPLLVEVRRLTPEEATASKIRNSLEYFEKRVVESNSLYAVRYLRAHPCLVEHLDLIRELVSSQLFGRISLDRVQDFFSKVKEALGSPDSE